MEDNTIPSLAICPVCGIQKIDNVFYWSHGPGKAESARVAAPPDAVYTRVCKFAKKSGCINSCGKLNKNYAYPTDLPNDSVKDILNIALESTGTQWTEINYDEMAKEVLANPEVQKAVEEHQTNQSLENSFSAESLEFPTIEG